MDKAELLSSDIKAFKSKEFGTKYWYVLFTMILGAYPNKLDNKNKEHLKIRKAFKSMMFNLRYTLPCSICRKSYIIFYRENKIENYLESKVKLAYWLYLLKDKVNRKLMKQSGVKLKNTSPPFIKVIKDYYLQKANTCSKELKSCI